MCVYMHENANKRTQSNKEKPDLISAHCVHALKHVSRVNVNEPIKKKTMGTVSGDPERPKLLTFHLFLTSRAPLFS